MFSEYTTKTPRFFFFLNFAQIYNNKQDLHIISIYKNLRLCNKLFVLRSLFLISRISPPRLTRFSKRHIIFTSHTSLLVYMFFIHPCELLCIYMYIYTIHILIYSYIPIYVSIYVSLDTTGNTLCTNFRFNKDSHKTYISSLKHS